MKREIVKRKFLHKLVRAEYKKFKDHKKIKLGKIFRLGYLDDTGCNWSIPIHRDSGWELAADFIRPYIIELRARYSLSD